MAQRKHCGDPNPHKPHTYYGPGPDPDKPQQLEYQCPGSR